MRVFREKPFFWGTKDVTRYFRRQHAGHDLVLRFAVYNALCEIESDLGGKPIKNFTKMICTYSGIKRQNVNVVIREFEKIGIVSAYRIKTNSGKLGDKYLVLEDKVPTIVPNRYNGENQHQLPLFGEGIGDLRVSVLEATNVPNRYNNKKVNTKDISSIGADASALEFNKKLFYDFKNVVGFNPEDEPEDREKLPRLIRQYCEKASQEFGIPAGEIPKRAMQWALSIVNKKDGSYYWRGNLRRLGQLRYKILPAYFEEKRSRANLQRVEQMKKEIFAAKS